jgi:hypothetical protein
MRKPYQKKKLIHKRLFSRFIYVLKEQDGRDNSWKNKDNSFLLSFHTKKNVDQSTIKEVTS